MENCKYLKKRIKQKQYYIYCEKNKKTITFEDCKNCCNKEYSTNIKNNNLQKICNRNKNFCNESAKKVAKTGKKVAKKKRITVSKETYNAVIKRDHYRCRLCDSIPTLSCYALYEYMKYYSKLSIRNTKLELHHIYYRSERKDLINDINNCIMLCSDCHRLVHSNKRVWQSILLKLIRGNHHAR